MKFDLHCHTKEGSLDAKTAIANYVRRLKNLGFDGMLVTDHNSYKGFDSWDQKTNDFVVLKGIEYDTIDAGHFLVILPDHVKLSLLKVRGLSVYQLERIVHKFGGILGPAHPFGSGKASLMNTKSAKAGRKLFETFDFVESFNGCEPVLSNVRAKAFAKRYHKISLGGSDAHRLSIVGCAFTIFKEPIRSNDDLIQLVKSGIQPQIPDVWTKVLQKENSWAHDFFIYTGYWIYHHVLTFINYPRRWRALRRYRRILS